MYPAGTQRIILHGSLPGGEEWETGFWMNDTGVTDASLANALANIIAGTITASDESGAIANMAGTVWSAYTTFESVRVYGYTGGSNKAAFVGEYVLPTPVNGSGNAQLPNQCAIVLTMRTALAGRQHRGRMYLPISLMGPSPSAQLTQPQAAAIAETWATFFSDVNRSSTGQIVVVSSVGSAATPLSAVSVDTRIDIQRSRAKQQAIVGKSTVSVTAHTG